MKVFRKYFVIFKLLVQLLSVLSYTVVLKQVKPLSPHVKVYRYEVRHPKNFPESSTQYIYHKPPLGQRIYPVAVKPGRDSNYKTRVLLKKEKAKFYKFSSTTEKPNLRDFRLPGLPQHLVPPVSNQLEEYSEGKEEAQIQENDIRPLPASPQTEKSFSAFGQEKGKIYTKPGDWATPAPQADSENTTKQEFTPSQLYLQIRHKNTVIHVPQSEALKDAETLEELINAPRLKELSRTTHVQETYSEEGYEDAGYDHAGHIRQAQHGEVYDAKDEGRFNIKEPPVILDHDSDLEESKRVHLKDVKETDPTEGNLTNKLEPRITRARAETSETSVEYAKTPKNYKGDHRYSSRIKVPTKKAEHNESEIKVMNTKEFPPTFPSFFEETQPTSEIPLSNGSVLSYLPPGKISSKYRKNDLNFTKIFPAPEPPQTSTHEYTDFKPYISMIDSQASPSTKSLKYSRIYSKKTKQLRLEPYKTQNLYSPPPPPPPPTPSLPHRDLQPPHAPDKSDEEDITNQRIVLPTIGYINSLTTAHFAKDNPKHVLNESKTELTDALNLTQALDYLRSNQNQKNSETTKPPSEIDIRTFEPMKLKKPYSRSFVGKTKRDVYLMGEKKRSQEKKEKEYEGSDESDEPHNEKNKDIAEDEMKRIEDENREKENLELVLRKELSNQEKNILKETFKNIGIQDDVSEVFPQFSSHSEPELASQPVETTPAPVDIRKYPFYRSKRLPENSPLRYATDPKQFPRKSGHQMEFYDSREKLIQCPDFHPDLDDFPNSNSTEYSEAQAGENQRLTGVGDKITCLRKKYFDPEPFDNPIFKEKEIDYVGKPRKRQKVQSKAPSNTTNFNKKQKHRQTSSEKSDGGKVKSQKPTEKLSVSPTPSTLLKPGYTAQATNAREILNQPTKIQNVFPSVDFHGNKTEKPRIIPVTEIVNEFPSYSTKTFQDTPKPRPPMGWKTTYRSNRQPQIHQQPTKNTKRMIMPHNCLPKISGLAALDGTKNLTIDCDDVTLIQEIVKNVAHLRIIPKEISKQEKPKKRKWSEKIPLHPKESDWVPIMGYPSPEHLRKSINLWSRRTDEITGLKNETTKNNSSVYVIDELKEDENVRKGEVVEDMDHYLQLMDGLKDETTEATTFKTESTTENSTRTKRQTQTQVNKPNKPDDSSKKSETGFAAVKTAENSAKSETEKPPGVHKSLELKRPLARLSGLDFLTRYHKSKGKHAVQKVEDFWKITTAGPTPTTNNQNLQKKIPVAEKLIQPTSKTKEKSEKRIPSESIIERTTKESEIRKEASEFRKPPTKIEQNTEHRKISPLNLIPEQITPKPELKSSEFWKTFNRNPSRPQNLTKIVTKISRETSESSERPRIVYKQPPSNLNSSVESPPEEATSLKPKAPKYKTISRSSTSRNNDSDLAATESPDGSTLYYVVNVKTGRGKWITNYEEQRTGLSGKHRKPQKLKEGSGAKRDKRRKKPKF